jgi:hypothetical protein
MGRNRKTGEAIKFKASKKVVSARLRAQGIDLI